MVGAGGDEVEFIDVGLFCGVDGIAGHDVVPEEHLSERVLRDI